MVGGKPQCGDHTEFLVHGVYQTPLDIGLETPSPGRGLERVFCLVMSKQNRLFVEPH